MFIFKDTLFSKKISKEELLSRINNSNFNIYVDTTDTQLPTYLWEYKNTKTYGGVTIYKNVKSAKESYYTVKELNAEDFPLKSLEFTDDDFIGYYYINTEDYWMFIKKDNIIFHCSFKEKSSNNEGYINEIKDEIVKVLSNKKK